MRVIIKDDKELVANWAANYVAYKINRFKPTPNKPFVLGLPTGSTPLGMYSKLIKLYQEGKVSFANVVTFNLDGLTKDYEKECSEYERKIKEIGGIHLFIGGVGEDGHIAFNEPFSSLSSRTRVKTLTESTIKANSRFFDYDLSKVPTQALTVGVGTIMDAKEVMILATGKNKAQALKHSIEEGISHVWTLSELQRHQYGIIVCDKDAVADLSESTVKYFLEIESKIPG